MASLRDIKGKIRAVGKTRQVTRAMEAVSAAKMRKSQERALSARPYAVSAFRILRRISGSLEKRDNALMVERPLSKILIVLITSDRGLAGALNSSVIKKVESFIREQGLTTSTAAFVSIGKKGHEHFKKRGYTITKDFGKNIGTSLTKIAEEAAQHATELFKGGEYSHVYVAYSNFVSTFIQEPKLHKVLPLSFSDVSEVVLGITPVKGKFSDMFAKVDAEATSEEGLIYLFEPSPERILEPLITNIITVLNYHGLLEAEASEFSARMVAMHSASDKALEMGKSLTLTYNKARQSTITREVSEIVGGVEALANA